MRKRKPAMTDKRGVILNSYKQQNAARRNNKKLEKVIVQKQTKQKYTFTPVGKCLLTQNKTQSDKQPDFKGDVLLNHEALQRLLDESGGRDIKVSLGAWIKPSKWDDGQIISCAFSTNELVND